MAGIQVTQEDIQNGIKGDEAECPIALALRRVYPYADVTVSYHSIWLDNIRYRPSAIIRHFIRNFDNERPVEPFGFDIDELENF